VLKNVGSILFSAYCWIATYSWMILGSLLLGWPAMLILGQQRGHPLVLRPLLGGCIPMCFNRTTVTKHPDFKDETRGVFMQNHVSVLDGSMATWVIPHPFCGLFNNWHFFIPGYGWIMKLSNGIGVKKGANRTGELGRLVKSRIEDKNISVLAFPEGHRTLDGKIGPFKRGVFFMARDAGVPVIPLCIRGMWEVQNKTHYRFAPGHLEVYIGKPIPTAGLTDDEVTTLAEDVRQMHIQWVENGVMPQTDAAPQLSGGLIAATD